MICEARRSHPTVGAKKDMKAKNQFPPDWDEKSVREVIDYYESQTDEEAAAEHSRRVAKR